MSYLGNSGAVLAALKGLQDKVRCLEEERTQSIENVQVLKGELARREEDFQYTQQLQDLTAQEQGAAARLSYERLLADKKAADIRLDETEEVQRELKEACENARDRGQDAHVAQLAAEAKVSILERRVEECEQRARERHDRCLRARKAVDRETAVVDAQMSALTARVEMLQRTLRDERTARKVVETNYLQAQSNTSRTSRYLDSILQVNQELVAASTGASPRPPPPSEVRRLVQPCGREKPKGIRRKKGTRGKRVPGQRAGAAPDGVDVGAAVAEAFRVGRAGGDPVLSLQALYERIGFCALQEEHGDEGTLSLPTSPSRTRGGETRNENGFQDEEENGFQKEEEDDLFLGMKHTGATDANGFFPRNTDEVVGSPVLHTNVRRGDKGVSGLGGGGWELGRGKGSGTAVKGYSFAHSPSTGARPVSATERPPKTARRLEALASQLEKEKADVEQWYRTVVNRAYPGAHGGGTDVNLDANCLTRAISCLQEKSQQLEVVRETIEALKASPRIGPTLSPTVRRRKVAALHVLQGLCQGVVDEETGVSGAS